MTTGNLRHNTMRADYADPQQYRGGESFDRAPTDAATRARARALREFLDRRRPSAVLEIGPGSGQLSRMIVEHPAVRHYCAVDINGAFLDFLEPRVRAIKRDDLTCTFVEGTVDDVPADARFDAAILISTVHHIPDRDHLFAAIRARLRASGGVLAIDPTHYLLRWYQLARKVLRKGYLTNAFADARRGQVGTHAMCQLAEYRSIARATGWHLSRVRFSPLPRKVRRLRAWGVPLGPVARWCAQEILVECEPAPPAPRATWAQALAPARWVIVIASLMRR